MCSLGGAHVSRYMELLLGFYSVGLIDGIIDHVSELSLQLTLLPLDLANIM